MNVSARTIGSGLAGLAMLVSAASAQAYAVKGLVACPDAVQADSQEESRLANKFWLLGYISARNFTRDAQVGADVAAEDIYARALGYCRENPADGWDDAARFVYESLR
jgi:hypothetical protein